MNVRPTPSTSAAPSFTSSAHTHTMHDTFACGPASFTSIHRAEAFLRRRRVRATRLEGVSGDPTIPIDIGIRVVCVTQHWAEMIFYYDIS